MVNQLLKLFVLALVSVETVLGYPTPQKFGGQDWNHGDNSQRHNHNFYQQPIIFNQFSSQSTAGLFLLTTAITPAAAVESTIQTANLGAGQIDVRIQQPQG